MRTALLLTSLLSTLAFTGCDDDHGSECHTHDDGTEHCGDHPQELITTITLTFTPAAGAPIIAEWDDADGDGGDAPVIDPIALAAGVTYDLTVGFENRLEVPAEDITEEIRDEAEDHQLFFTGTAVSGPATSTVNGALTHAYDDTDASGNPIGLANTIAATAGTGQLTVTLRHLPELNGQPQKTAGLADEVKAGGVSAIAGGTDATGTFAVTVQ